MGKITDFEKVEKLALGKRLRSFKWAENHIAFI